MTKPEISDSLCRDAGSKMSFSHLSWATRIFHRSYPDFLLVSEWAEKRKHLDVYILDLPKLVQKFKVRDSHPYEVNPQIVMVDEFPRIRLASTCEAAANSLYSMAELSAQFGNRLTHGVFPSSFNGLRKKLERGDYGNELLLQMGDLQWYRKIHEIRTEWVHHSAIFIGQRDGEPIMVIRAHRRASDKEEFSSEIQVTVPELIDWINGAIRTIDALGDYLLVNYILPLFPLNDEIRVLKYDPNGLPLMLSETKFDMEQITIREYLRRGGIELA